VVAILQSTRFAIHDLHQRLNPITWVTGYRIVGETLKTGSNGYDDTGQDEH